MAAAEATGQTIAPRQERQRASSSLRGRKRRARGTFNETNDRSISFLEQQVKRIEILKTKLKANDNKLLQAYMVSSLYTLQPPDRLDYAGMLMVGSRKEIKEKENYLSVLAVGRNILY